MKFTRATASRHEFGAVEIYRFLSTERVLLMSATAIAEVTQVIHAFAECWNRHDMDAFAELFAADAEFVNVVGL